jgi:methyl-accepting chemotaxis protein
MNAVFEFVIGPGTRLMQHLRLPVKFAIISAAFMAPLCVAVWSVYGNARDNIELGRRERLGTALVPHLNRFMEALATRTTDGTGARLDVGNAALSTLERLNDRQGDALGIGSDLRALHASWNDSARGDAGGDAQADALAAQVLALYAHLGDSSGLTLDPSLDTSYMAAIVIDYAPNLAQTAARSDALGRKAPETLSAAEQTEFQLSAARAAMLQDALVRAARRAVAANPALRDAIAPDRFQADDGGALALSDTAVRSLDAELAQRIDGFERYRNRLLALGLGGLALAVYLITSFYVATLRGFAALTTRMHKLAQGDLTTNFPARGTDEIGTLINAFNASRAQLQSLVQRVREVTDAIGGAGRQIASANDDLARRESSQSAAIRETSQSARDVQDTVQRNLDSALDGERLAEDARGVASRGNEAVGQVVATMQAITGSSRRIGDIIGVIDDIAFQTNLLALNAAVEAARAGEQGRGFAVVASEVRNLAQRSATAAQEIKKLVGASLGDVERGAALVNGAGATMQDILRSVQRVSQIMKEIALASRNQSDDIGRLNQSIGRIDTDTRENAARVTETASVARLLREQVDALLDAVDSFRLGTLGKGTPPIAPDHDRPQATPGIPRAA